MGSPSLCAKPAKVAASNSSKVNLASRDNKANKVVSSNKLVVAKVVSRINLVLHLVKVRDKVNKASLKVKVLVELVNSNTTTTKAAVKVDSSKVKADSKTKVTAKDKATSNNKLEVNRTKAMVKVKTSSSNSTMPPGGRIRLSSRRLASTRQESGMRISGYDNAPDRRARQQGWQSADYQNWYHGTSRGCHGFFR